MRGHVEKRYQHSPIVYVDDHLSFRSKKARREEDRSFNSDIRFLSLFLKEASGYAMHFLKKGG